MIGTCILSIIHDFVCVYCPTAYTWFMVQNIILTGFMGTGKTAVGRALAKRLEREFVDTDVMIEARDGRTIPQIFAESGEAVFREMEQAVVLELAGREGLVIATGGRLMLDLVNAAALERNGQVFCLTASSEVILVRLAGEGVEGRPLLGGDDPAGRLVALLAERRDGYGRFEQVVTDRRTVDEVVDVILKRIINS
jgi:shikimate kinase